MSILGKIQSYNVTPAVKVVLIQSIVALFIFLGGYIFGSNKVGRFQMFHGISTVAISQNGSTQYEKEDNVFLIDTTTGKVRKYAHDSMSVPGKTIVYEGWNHVLRPIGEEKDK